MPGPGRFRHRDTMLPGAVASAVAYETHDHPTGSHRGLPSPWITFIVSVNEPVRVSGTVEEGDGFDPGRATAVARWRTWRPTCCSALASSGR